MLSWTLFCAQKRQVLDIHRKKVESVASSMITHLRRGDFVIFFFVLRKLLFRSISICLTYNSSICEITLAKRGVTYKRNAKWYDPSNNKRKLICFVSSANFREEKFLQERFYFMKIFFRRWSSLKWAINRHRSTRYEIGFAQYFCRYKNFY